MADDTARLTGPPPPLEDGHTSPGGNSLSADEQEQNHTVSVHRAFIYAALAPGFGEWYAGARIRGAAICTVFLAVFIWGCWLLTITIIALMDLALGKPLQDPLPLVGLGTSFFLAVALWFWGMAGAVHAAVRTRQQSGAPPQIHPAWGVAMSWLCPGAGQLSLNRLPMGFILLGLYVLVFPTLVPAMAGLRGVLDNAMASAGQFLQRPDLVMHLARDISVHIELSFPSLAQDGIKAAAIALYCATLGPLPGALGSRLAMEGQRWTASPLARGAGLIVLGWLCPGAPQLLQGREPLGWSLLGTYLVVRATGGVLLVQGVVQANEASRIASLASFVLVASIVEGLVHMILTRLRETKDLDSNAGESS